MHPARPRQCQQALSLDPSVYRRLFHRGLRIDGSHESGGRGDQWSLLQIDPLSDPRWDRWLDGREDASFFHTSHWLSLLRQCYGYAPFSIVAAKGEEWQGGIPCADVKSAWTGRRGISLPFTD